MMLLTGFSVGSSGSLAHAGRVGHVSRVGMAPVAPSAVVSEIRDMHQHLSASSMTRLASLMTLHGGCDVIAYLVTHPIPHTRTAPDR